MSCTEIIANLSNNSHNPKNNDSRFINTTLLMAIVTLLLWITIPYLRYDHLNLTHAKNIVDLVATTNLQS